MRYFKGTVRAHAIVAGLMGTGDDTGSGTFDWPDRHYRGHRVVHRVGPRGKLADRIASDVRSVMVAAGWPFDALLGSERALAERYSVSRSVIREAARLLEHQGIVKVRRGPDGGLVTAAPTHGIVANSLGVFFDFFGVTLDELVQLQIILDPWAARAAAERGTDNGITALRGASELQQALGAEIFSSREGGLHAAIARECGNPMIAMLVGSLAAVLARYSPVAADRLQPSGDRTMASIRKAHGAVLEAIECRDGSRAEQVMARHVTAMANFLATTHGTRQEWTDVRMRSETLRADGPQKLAEIVAERIKDDIVAQGWPTGSKLGTEPGLMERYGVSRGVFREAVRLLEHHSVVKYVPGRDGGLLVDEPTIEALIEAATAFLLYNSATYDNLVEARVLLECEAVALAATKVSAEDASRLVTPLIAQDEKISGMQCTSSFHVELCRLAGNRALALVIHMLTELQRRGLFNDGREASSAAYNPLAEHGAIFEAVLAGNAERAVERARVHLMA